MYLSHPVRRMREEPLAGEEVGLVVELDAGPGRLRETVEALGGSVEEELGYDCWHVTVPETAVDDLCDLPGVERIETAETISLGLDENLPDAPNA